MKKMLISIFFYIFILVLIMIIVFAGIGKPQWSDSTTVAQPKRCYQETANISTYCGGLSG